jgi:hypothetical protein
MIENLLVALLIFFALFDFKIGVDNFSEDEPVRWIVFHLLCITKIFLVLLILN